MVKIYITKTNNFFCGRTKNNNGTKSILFKFYLPDWVFKKSLRVALLWGKKANLGDQKLSRVCEKFEKIII